MYVPPNYGVKPVRTTERQHPPLPQHEAKLIPCITGSINWYARAVDSTMLFLTHRLGVRQASPQPSDLRASKKLLSYAATHPNAHTTLYPSQMRLIIHTDGSHLFEPHSRSRAASVKYLSFKGDPLLAPLNGAVDMMSTIIPVVCGSAHETEYGTYYLADQRAINTRNTLEDIGYPQPTTSITCDNRTASGVANNEIREKRSKSMHKNFHWIRDQCDHGTFKLIWAPGKFN